MSKASSVEKILGKAKAEEKLYEWLKAADHYHDVMTMVVDSDFLMKGEICEDLAYAVYKAAFQADDSTEFKNTMGQALTCYGEAKKLYERSADVKKAARIYRCDAMIDFSSYWLAPEAAEKKRLLDECWQLTKNSLKGMKDSGEANEFGRTYNQLSGSAIFKFCLSCEFETRKTTTIEALGYGEQAIKLLSTLEDPRELARIYAQTATYLGMYGYYFTDLDEKETDFQKAKIYWLKAQKLDEEVALPELLYPVFGPHLALWGEATEEAFANLEKALTYGKKNRDKFTLGAALDWLAYHNAWSTNRIDDEDVSLNTIKKLLQNAEDARRYYSVILFISPRDDGAWTGAVQGQFIPGYDRETDQGKKRNMLEKAIEAARDGFHLAELSGYPEVIAFVHAMLSYQLRRLAEIGTNSEERKKLLEEALQHGKEYVRSIKQFRPLEYWDNGNALIGLAEVGHALSEIPDDDPETRKSKLQEAIIDGEKGIRLMIRALTVAGKRSPVLFGDLGRCQFQEGVWLSQLYKLCNKEEHSRKSIGFFSEAAISFEKIQRTTRVAECHWNIARTYDALGEHTKAAESFNLASENYNTAASKIPQLKEFYQNYSHYMGAWSEIEKGRHHHENQEYSVAAEHFEKAAELQDSSTRWSYLAPSYAAWSKVEHAEESSRKEHDEEALEGFQQSANLFEEAKRSIQVTLDKIENLDEEQMAESILSAAGLRHEYCKARMAIEEAKILDKKGDHHSSSQKYGSAVETLEQLTQKLESEPDKRECQFITCLSRAWQKMADAEAKESPQHYDEASRLFEEAKDLGQGEKTKTLMLGHSRFCKALEAGAKFADNRDNALHSSAKEYLESAANYYMKAGFPNASEYARATGLLFDAYVYMTNAAKEIDPEKKAKLFMMTERVLQASAASYTNAENPAKKERVLGFLEKVRQEKELAVSLTEIFNAPIIASTTAFAAPASTSEKAAGLEKFEHAEVESKLILSRNELRVGEDVEIEIGLANAGRGQALLNLIEGAVPEGFEIRAKPEAYHVEGFNINMKGKRLDPLKTEEVKLGIRPKHKGSFAVAPRILYLDENGNAKSNQPEPVTITVGELGIKGWLRGEK